MGTRSRIGIELKDGSILSAYHHWDGYPEWLGKTLVEQYNSKEKASELIDGGDMSCCWSDSLWGKQLLKVNMLQSIILCAVKIALLVLIKIWMSSSLMVKNTLHLPQW